MSNFYWSLSPGWSSYAGRAACSGNTYASWLCAEGETPLPEGLGYFEARVWIYNELGACRDRTEQLMQDARSTLAAKHKVLALRDRIDERATKLQDIIASEGPPIAVQPHPNGYKPMPVGLTYNEQRVWLHEETSTLIVRLKALGMHMHILYTEAGDKRTAAKLFDTSIRFGTVAAKLDNLIRKDSGKFIHDVLVRIAGDIGWDAAKDYKMRLRENTGIRSQIAHEIEAGMPREAEPI